MLYDKCLDAWVDATPAKKIADLEQQLLEANAKIERLTAAMVQTDWECRLRFDQPEPYETLLSQAMKESPAQSLALHDADVIERMLDRIEPTCDATERMHVFMTDYIRELRASVKEGG